MPGYL